MGEKLFQIINIALLHEEKLGLVDGNGDGRYPGVKPCPKLLAGAGDHIQVQPDTEAIGLEQGDEFAGIEERTVFGLPAYQRFTPATVPSDRRIFG